MLDQVLIQPRRPLAARAPTRRPLARTNRPTTVVGSSSPGELDLCGRDRSSQTSRALLRHLERQLLTTPDRVLELRAATQSPPCHGPPRDARPVFWITSRAAGVVALLAASAAVALGLLMGGRLRQAPRRATCASLHEALSLATLVALAVHALALLGDGYLDPSLADITIPFVSGYQRLWMAAGIVARLDADLLGLSYYARGADRRRRAGARCTASPRWPGCSASCTRSARAPTPARPGSCVGRRDRRAPGGRAARRAARADARPGGARHDASTRRASAASAARCAVRVGGAGAARPRTPAPGAGCSAWHDRFTPLRPAQRALAAQRRPARGACRSARDAARARRRGRATPRERTGGLVDGTLLREIEAAGYRSDLAPPLPLALALRLAPPRRRRGRAGAAARWRAIAADAEAGMRAPPAGRRARQRRARQGPVRRPARRAARAARAASPSTARGDLRLGGAGRAAPVHGRRPVRRRAAARVRARRAAASATSGIGRRSWLDAPRPPAHHLLDPATGRPAFTGVVQATALAPTALEAEIRAKAARARAARTAPPAGSPHGGVARARRRLLHGPRARAQRGRALAARPCSLRA